MYINSCLPGLLQHSYMETKQTISEENRKKYNTVKEMLSWTREFFDCGFKITRLSTTVCDFKQRILDNFKGSFQCGLKCSTTSIRRLFQLFIYSTHA